MKRFFLTIPLMVFAILFSLAFSKQTSKPKEDYWLLKRNKSTNLPGYVDRSGKVKIAYGKYIMAYTDTFRKIAFVLDSQKIIGINRNCEKLFYVFNYDTGPDYLMDSLFRISSNSDPLTQKIGFANMDGKIIIPATLDFAQPFLEELAAFCVGCKMKYDDEHLIVEGGKWGYINKKGEVVIAPQYKMANDFQNDTAWVKTDSANYFIDKTGKVLKKF